MMLARSAEAPSRHVQPIHPRDLVGATQDHKAIHLHAEDFDRDWQQIPDGPLGLILVAASLVSIICALVLYL